MLNGEERKNWVCNCNEEIIFLEGKGGLTGLQSKTTTKVVFFFSSFFSWWIERNSKVKRKDSWIELMEKLKQISEHNSPLVLKQVQV